MVSIVLRLLLYLPAFFVVSVVFRLFPVASVAVVVTYFPLSALALPIVDFASSG